MGYFINKGRISKFWSDYTLKRFLDLSAEDAEVIEYTNRKGELIKSEPVKEPEREKYNSSWCGDFIRHFYEANPHYFRNF